MCSSIAVSLLTSCPENTSTLGLYSYSCLFPGFSSSSNPWPSFCSQLNPFLHQFYLLASFSLTSAASCPLSVLDLATPVIAQMPTEGLGQSPLPTVCHSVPHHPASQLPARHHPWVPQISNNCFPLCLLIRTVCLICAQCQGMSSLPVLCSP